MRAPNPKAGSEVAETMNGLFAYAPHPWLSSWKLSRNLESFDSFVEPSTDCGRLKRSGESLNGAMYAGGLL
jgi:hypothetical protein